MLSDCPAVYTNVGAREGKLETSNEPINGLESQIASKDVKIVVKVA